MPKWLWQHIFFSTKGRFLWDIRQDCTLVFITFKSRKTFFRLLREFFFYFYAIYLWFFYWFRQLTKIAVTSMTFWRLEMTCDPWLPNWLKWHSRSIDSQVQWHCLHGWKTSLNRFLTGLDQDQSKDQKRLQSQSFSVLVWSFWVLGNVWTGLGVSLVFLVQKAGLNIISTTTPISYVYASTVYIK